MTKPFEAKYQRTERITIGGALEGRIVFEEVELTPEEALALYLCLKEALTASGLLGHS